MSLKYLNALLPEEKDEELHLAEGFVESVYGDMNDIKHSFFRIGFRLHEAAQMDYHKVLGYANITDLALDKFGFSKSTTYELIGIYKLAHRVDAPFQIAEKYDEYSQSQLRELCRLSICTNEFMQIVKPSDKVADIGKAVTFWNKYCSKHSGSPYVTTIGELLKLDINTSIDATRRKALEKPENSAYAEKPVKVTAEEPAVPAPEESEQIEKPAEVVECELMDVSDKTSLDNCFEGEDYSRYEENETYFSDEELIAHCLREEVGQNKVKIYDTVKHIITTAELSSQVKNAYGWGGHSDDKYYSGTEYNSKGFTIVRRNGGKINLSWNVVAGRIKLLIENNGYLSDEELERYKFIEENRAHKFKAVEQAEKELKAEIEKERGRLDLKNDKARKDWLENFRSWGVWLEVKEVDKTFYRYEFKNGAKLIVEVSKGYNDWYDGTVHEYDRTGYSLIDENHPKFNSQGESCTSVIQWLTKHAKEI